MIEAKIVADSINPCGSRIISFVCTYPRFIHSEIMTHRVFSRNAASSRAIPIQKMIDRIRTQPAEPIFWGKNQRGMQAWEQIEETAKARETWLKAAESAIVHAQELTELGIHKQIANRLLEPFAHMVTLITATEWANFFNLRAHKDAQPEFQELAFQMLLAYCEHKPEEKAEGEWHLPFADKYVEDGLTTTQLLKITSARAARVSYINFEGDIEFEKDYALHDQLIESGHCSPLEHPARALVNFERSGNFVGWFQYRKSIIYENRTLLDPEKLFKERVHHGTHN